MEVASDAPLIVGIDTSTKGGSCALMRGEECLGEVTLAPRPHSETLVPALEFLLGQVGLRPADADAFAVAGGPGAFTGLRIGVTTAKGLAVANRKPLVVVPTLEALAVPLRGRGPWVATVLDARRGEVWASLWRVAGVVLEEVEGPIGIKPAEWAAMVGDRAEGAPVLFVGDGVALCRAAAESADKMRYREASPWDHRIRASVVARLGGERLLAGRVDDPATAAPVYLRSQAGVFEPRSEREEKAG